MTRTREDGVFTFTTRTPREASECHAQVLKLKEEEIQLLASYLTDHVKKALARREARLTHEETDMLARKTGWGVWKVLSVWMRVTGREHNLERPVWEDS